MSSARLFAAITLNAAEKKELLSISQLLRQHCTAGRFTGEGLLHITLHFFGQTPLDRLTGIEAAMRQAAGGCKPFSLATGRAGTFGRRDSSVLWLGLEGGAAELKALQATLEKALAEQGFPCESRAFKAHITLGRDVQTHGGIQDIELPAINLAVNGITLMGSNQASGRLEYVPMLTVPF